MILACELDVMWTSNLKIVVLLLTQSFTATGCVSPVKGFDSEAQADQSGPIDQNRNRDPDLCQQYGTQLTSMATDCGFVFTYPTCVKPLPKFDSNSPTYAELKRNADMFPTLLLKCPGQQTNSNPPANVEGALELVCNNLLALPSGPILTTNPTAICRLKPSHGNLPAPIEENQEPAPNPEQFTDNWSFDPNRLFSALQGFSFKAIMRGLPAALLASYDRLKTANDTQISLKMGYVLDAALARMTAPPNQDSGRNLYHFLTSGSGSPWLKMSTAISDVASGKMTRTDFSRHLDSFSRAVIEAAQKMNVR